jgi:catechol 2,3-dioxygenase-like lactoylglutathione lyase family enzyme
MVTARLSLVTLGIADMARSVDFYEALGFIRSARGSGEEIAFFDAGGVVLALYPVELLAADAQLSAAPPAKSFRGVTLAWNCASEDAVDAVLDRAWESGGRLIKPAGRAQWGGYHGYFADPDDHAWEVAHNPFFPLAADGRLLLPE